MKPAKNKYIKNARISKKKTREIFACFSEDLTAETTSRLTGVSRITINRLYTKIRERILEISITHSPFKGTVEIDESYFGPKRVRGKRGRGAGGKTKVFGILKREGGKVYTEIIPDCSRKSLQKIISGKVDIESVINTDGWRAYDGLVDIGYSRHHRVIHSRDEFARGSSHINGIESFWSYTKRRLAKFNGIKTEKFMYHLKESEFRWNIRTGDKKMYKVIMRMFREYPL